MQDDSKEADLQGFNPNACCPKCHSTDIATRWCSGFFKGAAWGEVRHVDEAIHRNCSRCRYEWLELPLDTKPPQEKEVAPS